MKTVGEILKTARLEKELSLVQAAKATKIQAKFLQALEVNRFQRLPSVASAKGFLKNYAEFLGLSSQPVLAIFRRDFTQNEEGRIVPQTMAETTNQKGIRWNPKLTLIAFLVVFFLSLIVYLGYQYFSLSKKPYLEVLLPEEKTEIFAEKVELLGRADPDALVTVNGHPVFLVQSGEFRYKLDLFSGENKIVVEAKSKLGKKARVERIIFHP